MLNGTSWGESYKWYKWYQQILGCEDARPIQHAGIPVLRPPASYPPRPKCVGHRTSAHPPSLLGIPHSSLLLNEIHAFVPCSLLVRGDPFSSSLYKGVCSPGVLRGVLFNKKGKMQDNLADRNPPWSETRSERSQCEEMVPAWKLYVSISK